MNRYYICIDTFGTPNPRIINEDTLDQAERGENYLNPDDFMFHCEAPSMEAAIKVYWQEFSEHWNQIEGESSHP